MKNALEHVEEILARGCPALFLDFDGTLADIAHRPAYAVLPESIRDVLRDLSTHGIPVAVVSGRDLEDLRARVALPEVSYGGSHGFDLLGPAPLSLRHQPGAHLLPVLDDAESDLRARLAAVPDIFMERKRFAFAVHYRQVAEPWLDTIAREVREALVRHPGVQMREGKKVYELLPDVAWDKGEAVRWMIEHLRPAGVPIYIGDDVSDEDAFRVLAGRGIGIVVQEAPAPTAAAYRLRDPGEVEQFLWKVAGRYCPV
jgi:trehalose 6-phosphate phosphatase